MLFFIKLVLEIKLLIIISTEVTVTNIYPKTINNKRFFLNDITNCR